jgi:hypothetical protein
MSKNPEEGFFCIKSIRSKSGELHFKRWRILETPWFNIYIHKICKSDKDKFPHDHPWNYRTIILKGIYKESLYPTYDDMSDPRSPGVPLRKTLLPIRNTFGPGDSVRREWYDGHQIELIKGPVWTLVITGKHRGTWGYITDKGWVDHQTYRQQKNTGEKNGAGQETENPSETPQSRFELPD